ncbi:hypothetical protein MKC74_05910 [[Clostridium] innocuum]|nr:hypothetical protein [[Clostridium] innocuum]
MQRIKKALKNKGIVYSQSYDGSQITIGEYPKYIIVYMTDRDYTPPDYPHTGTFYWEISWNDWKKSSTPKRNQAYTPAEATKIISKLCTSSAYQRTQYKKHCFFERRLNG